MRILITGGSGFIGRNLAEQLGSSYDVEAPTSAQLDLLKEENVRDYLSARHFDVIVHAATTRSNRKVSAPADMLDRNCRMFFNLVRNQGSFGKMIHFGSGAEYGPRRLLPMRVREDYFDTHVPTDAYGFSKYICAKYIESLARTFRNVVELRLFAVFGPYEDYSVRFISNACCRAVKGLPIVVRQDVTFDYLYAKDLVRITRWFMENETKHWTYNVCSGRPIALSDLAQIVSQVNAPSRGTGPGHPGFSVINPGMGEAYTGDNTRLMEEIGEYKFWDLRDAIADLYSWYQVHESAIDEERLKFDEKSG